MSPDTSSLSLQGPIKRRGCRSVPRKHEGFPIRRPFVFFITYAEVINCSRLLCPMPQTVAFQSLYTGKRTAHLSNSAKGGVLPVLPLPMEIPSLKAHTQHRMGVQAASQDKAPHPTHNVMNGAPASILTLSVYS